MGYEMKGPKDESHKGQHVDILIGDDAEYMYFKRKKD